MCIWNAMPPVRPETAGLVEEQLGDVDREPTDSSETTLENDNDSAGTPDSASGEMGETI